MRKVTFNRATLIAAVALVAAMIASLLHAPAGSRAAQTDFASLATAVASESQMSRTVDAAAAVDYFLKIDGIPGESTDSRHKGEIDIQSFSWGVSNAASATGGGGGAGKATFSDISFTKVLDKASPLLMLTCATGKHIKTVTMVARKAGERPLEFLKITLTDVLVSSYQSSGGGEVPQDSFSLNFAKIEIEYKPQAADGTAGAAVKAGYDLKANKKV